MLTMTNMRRNRLAQEDAWRDAFSPLTNALSSSDLMGMIADQLGVEEVERLVLGDHRLGLGQAARVAHLREEQLARGRVVMQAIQKCARLLHDAQSAVRGTIGDDLMGEMAKHNTPEFLLLLGVEGYIDVASLDATSRGFVWWVSAFYKKQFPLLRKLGFGLHQDLLQAPERFVLSDYDERGEGPFQDDRLIRPKLWKFASESLHNVRLLEDMAKMDSPHRYSYWKRVMDEPNWDQHARNRTLPHQVNIAFVDLDRPNVIEYWAQYPCSYNRLDALLNPNVQRILLRHTQTKERAKEDVREIDLIRRVFGEFPTC